jgi:hypothetical protein
MSQDSTGGKKIGIDNLAPDVHRLQIMIHFNPEGIKRLAVGDEKGRAKPVSALMGKFDRKVK